MTRRAKDPVAIAKHTGFVYLMQCNGPDGPVKIGWSVDVERRLSMVRVDNPFPVELLASIPSDDVLRDEANLHARFAQSHIRGEWFAASPGLLRFAKDARRIVQRGMISILSGEAEP
jgi:hypothetical protein